MTIVGNVLIVVTVIASPSLGSPMYFFLACLSFLDIVYSTSISPKLIMDLVCDKKSISFTACMSQLFIEHLFGGTEIVILVAMAYDHYVAICKPLHYLTIMNRRVCIILLIFSWLGGFTHSLIQIVFVFNLPFCGPNIIDHFIVICPHYLDLCVLTLTWSHSHCQWWSYVQYCLYTSYTVVWNHPKVS